MNEINRILATDLIDEADHYIKKVKRNYKDSLSTWNFPTLDQASNSERSQMFYQAVEIVTKINDLMLSLEEKRDQIYHNPIGEYEIDAIEVQLSKLYNKGFELMQSFEITCEDI